MDKRLKFERSKQLDMQMKHLIDKINDIQRVREKLSEDGGEDGIIMKLPGNQNVALYIKYEWFPVSPGLFFESIETNASGEYEKLKKEFEELFAND